MFHLYTPQNILTLSEYIWNIGLKWIKHCMGAIDGKHISIECLKNSGSLYYNCKGFFILVVMAMLFSVLFHTC